MTVADELEKLRTSVPDCSVVIFGDLSSQITLCVSARTKYPQEQLDATCVMAGNLLDGPVADSIAATLGQPAGRPLSRAVVLGPDDTQVFLRSPSDEADVLCCVGSLDLDPEDVAQMAAPAFQRISEYQ